MSSQNSVEQEVIEIIAEQAMLDPSDVQKSTTLDELGVDSMAVVECIFAIEERFDIQIPFNANDPSQSDFDISSVQTVIDGVEKLCREQGKI